MASRNGDHQRSANDARFRPEDIATFTAALNGLIDELDADGPTPQLAERLADLRMWAERLFQGG